MKAQYTVKITEDGSPTLVLSTVGPDDLPLQEKMHSRFGAASETIFIYGPAIRWAFENVAVPKFSVVGLGLGYIEFLIVKEALSKGTTFFEINSFESEDYLKDSMLTWLHEEAPNSLNVVFDSALTAIGLKQAQEIKEQLRILHENGKWRLSNGIAKDSLKFSATPANCIIYDLFSSNMNPELWQESFLTDFLTKLAAPTCSFATYAAKGAIKRTLKKLNFKLSERPGFAGKRENTLAFRTSANQMTIADS